jgi:hypothetical protein
MFRMLNNPWLADFIIVAAQMPEDERAQLEAFTGEQFNVDGAAMGGFSVAGPKWVAKVAETEEQFDSGGARPIAVGGFALKRPGVWRDFMLNTPEAFDAANWFRLTRECRRIMDGMLNSGAAHRLECVVPASRLAGRPELRRWYKLLGYNEEGLRYGYLGNGQDAVAFSRVKH